ncbi:MAG: flagellar biosynthesis protein FlhB [candidate division Zixibacteria bacterium HGW-Zixibacteria-1]|nr:MAG: flagellar biosynthesis protein FlhB [candidate division Zixibacteria bacterium HGW-Zixibacteria-1]
MAEDSFQERNERATPRRRQKAREEGRVARSQELNSAVILCLGIVTLYLVGPLMVNQMKDYMGYIFTEAPNIRTDFDSLQALLASNIMTFFLMMGPLLIVLALIAYGINVLQVGILFTGKPLEPKLDKLNMTSGIKRLFSSRTLFQLVRDVAKLIVIGTVGYFSIKSQIDSFFTMSDKSIAEFAGAMGLMALKTTLQIGAAILFLALLDYGYQKYDFEKSIRMSKQDLRDEFKDTEGSPQTKSRVRQIQREMSRRRMMQEIPKADVVITNPTHIAVALKYDQTEMEAPMVVAKGERLIAEKIKEIAREANIPVVENKPLARALFNMCEIGSYVPGKLYRAVAEVLAYVYRLKQETMV